MDNFPYSPDFKYKVTSRYNVESTQYENKVEDSRLITSKKLRTFELSAFTSRLKAEIDAVIAFFDAQKENLTPFTITIDEESITGKFEPGTFWYSKVSAGIYEYGFTFQEVP
jgi:hypothetical protein